MSKQSGFKKGSGCYKCRSCGRSTRATGSSDAEHLEMCTQCYDLGGIDNAFQDGDGSESYRQEALRLYNEIIEKGGKIDRPEYLDVVVEDPKVEVKEESKYWIDGYFNVADAKKLITKHYGTGITLFIAVGQFAATAEDTTHGYNTMVNVKVSHTTAMKFIEDMYDRKYAKPVVLRVTALGKCIFIGQAS